MATPSLEGPPLTGLRIVEMTSGIAGPYCGKLLADAGADVVKVEPSSGDPMRAWSSSGTTTESDSALFSFLNTNKRSVVGGPTSREVEQLIDRADIVILDNECGLTVDEIAVLADGNPSTVIICITPFGLHGPYAEFGYSATEFTLQALCGSLASRGLPDDKPLQAGGRIGEWVSGTYAAVAALAASRTSRAVGQGELIDLSLLECMTSTMGGLSAVGLSVLGSDFVAGSTRSIELPSIVETLDGLVGFCTITAQQFQDFLIMIERPDLLDDAELATAHGRMQRRAEFEDIVSSWTSRRTTDDIIELASSMRIPVAPIGSPDTIEDIDHFQIRDIFVKNPAGFTQPRSPYRIDSSARPTLEPAPSLGAHTGSVLWESTDKHAPTTPRHPKLPLEGIRVLDFTAFWAGPSATFVMAALGAEVIKVEGLKRPDGMRYSGGRPPSTDSWWETGSVFLSCNGNKKDVTLELSRPEALEVALQLVAASDVIIENFSPRVMPNLGLDWTRIHETNPGALLVRMPAFGLDGPWKDRVGFAQTMEQASGMAWLTGESNLPPLIPRGPCDPIAGLHAVFATLVALEKRDQTGQGGMIECPMVEAALNVAAEVIVEHSANGAALTRDGNRSPTSSPQGAYQCTGEDNWVAISVVTDEQWTSIVHALNLNSTPLDIPALNTRQNRRAHADAIDCEISKWTASKEVTEVVSWLQGLGVPAAKVSRPADLLENGQLEFRNFFESVTHPIAGEHITPGLPFKFRSNPEPWTRRPAPLLGEHTTEVLGHLLALSNEDLAALAACGVTGDRPFGL
ncbi:CoA transferase [Rhodococcus sp. IEGM 1366]|uniref:CaiB/BaiF CoA transferase family protein n=1 Tax=Rhodococcus sp. IEGM 1366 TaxID=3082223 RepID=UPI002954343C|nr:CoA transferase [Rhodococcus sp. IEGM 1366]MDV8071359.1 CoA transferase [Rhodococcus sp. IEGM 1366]